ASLESDGDRLPHSRIGVATVDRLTDPNAAPAVIDAVVISAEVASTGASDAAGQNPTSPEPAVPVPPKFQAGGADEPAPAAEPEPEPVAADDEDMPLELPAVDEETDEPVYRLPANETMAPSPEPPMAADDEETAADTEEPPAGEEIAPPAPAVPVSTTDGAGRIRFKGASLDVSGLVATATVKLV